MMDIKRLARGTRGSAGRRAASRSGADPRQIGAVDHLDSPVRSGHADRSQRREQTTSSENRCVYVDICDALVSRVAAERMLPLMLKAVAAGTNPAAAAEEIDGLLREELGADWNGERAMIQRGIRRLASSKRARSAAERLGPPLIELIPGSLRPSLARIHRPLARYLAAANYRRKYGDQFVWKIHDQDDLLHYGLDAASAEPPFRYYRAVSSYLEGGAWNVSEVEKVLDDVGFSLHEAGSFLEFACGYGRLTRHFVHMVRASKITVSDIDHRAVDFVKEQFGVHGFYSAPTAEQLTYDDRYDVIVVVSLFSHLPMEQWRPWLTRLNDMLTANGLLLFSTLGMHAWSINVNEADRDAFQAKADGFFYREENETRGHLSGADYGTAYVSEKYVERLVLANFADPQLEFFPRALNGFQDAYVLQRADERQPITSVASEEPAL
jgi:2-polyprenyl-3-methyl-5-hydroxy-6-metoxy-1,4-benzoquinol methylase